MSNQKGWIGVDLDGTLATYDKWEGPDKIGAPVPAMVALVRQHLASGTPVKVFTARVSPAAGPDATVAREAIAKWCVEHVGAILPVTHEKDFAMIRLYDDRAVTVEPNTGVLLSQPPGVKPPDFKEPETFNAWLNDVETILKSVRDARTKSLGESGTHNCPLSTWHLMLSEELGNVANAIGETHAGRTDVAGVKQAVTDLAERSVALLQYLEKGWA